MATPHPAHDVLSSASALLQAAPCVDGVYVVDGRLRLTPAARALAIMDLCGEMIRVLNPRNDFELQIALIARTLQASRDVVRQSDGTWDHRSTKLRLITGGNGGDAA